ncbi:MAG TPA: PilW family protein [Burkholderiaceae bacterium]|nr:PilW family protein [Burkholderiaceae bacterium]
MHRTSYTQRPGPRALERGLTLVELMVAMTIGLLLIAATTAIFINSSNVRRQIESSADVIENGRYGLDVLTRELSLAGYYGTLGAPNGVTINLCSTDPAVWADSLAVHAVGLNNAQADPACLNRKAGTDAIFVQRASTCTTADAGAGCGEDASNAYLQVSECGDEYSITPFVVAKGQDAALKLQTRACDGTKAEKRKLIRRIYYISTADVLSYVDVTLAGVTAPVPLVENIEQMQVEYAVDANNDGTPDTFSATPADWSGATGLRVWLLARSADTSTQAAKALTIQISDTTVDVPAAARNFKRRVYSTYIPFTTPKSRRES